MPITSRQLPTLLEGDEEDSDRLASGRDEGRGLLRVHRRRGRHEQEVGVRCRTTSRWARCRSGRRTPRWKSWRCTRAGALRVSQVAFGGKVVITKQMREFDQADLIESSTMQLGMSGRADQGPGSPGVLRLRHAGPFGHPQAARDSDHYPKGPATASRSFSKNHKWRSNDAYAWSNLVDNYVEPTESGVFAVHKLVSRWKAPNGRPLMIDLDRIMIPHRAGTGRAQAHKIPRRGGLGQQRDQHDALVPQERILREQVSAGADGLGGP